MNETMELLRVIEGTIQIPFELVEKMTAHDLFEFGRSAVTRFETDAEIEPELAYFRKAKVPFREIGYGVGEFRRRNWADTYFAFTSGKVEFDHTIKLHKEGDMVFMHWRCVYHGPDSH